MMAQVDLLSDRGHPYSEIDQRIDHRGGGQPQSYMDYKGVSYMVDNCSTTARLGARKWASRFDYTSSSSPTPRSRGPGRRRDPVRCVRVIEDHEVLAVCAELRPSVDIAVVPLRG